MVGGFFMRSRIVLLGLVTALACVLGFLTFTPIQALLLVKYGGYWLTLLTFSLFAVFLVRSLRDCRPILCGEGWRARALPLLTILGGAAFLHVHEPHGYKIVMDEIVLQSTAMRMHQDREVSVAARAYDYAGNFTVFSSYIDKRPLFFPFLLSLVHDLTGYRTANAFWLNGALTVALLGLLHAVGRRAAGPEGGLAAVLLVCTVPLVAQNAASAGFELLNLVMILVALWLGMRSAEKPDDDRLSAFVLSGVLLAQVRYESVLFILPVGAAVLYGWWRERRVRLPWPLLVTPLLLVVYPMQYNVFKLSEASWQLDDVAGATTPFSPAYFYDNVGHAMNFLFSIGGSQPNSWLLAGLGCLGVGFFVLLLYRRHRVIFSEEPARAVLCIFLLGLVLHAFLMLCYFWGKWDDPLIRRLSLPAHLLLVLALVTVWSELVPHRQRWRALIAATLVYLIGVTAPAVSAHRYTQENFAARTSNWLAGHISGYTDAGRQVLAIDTTTGLLWFLHRQSSVTISALSLRPEAYLWHFNNRSFTDYLVVQRAAIDFTTGERVVALDDAVGDGFELELIEEKAFAPNYLVRLSRVVAVDEEKLKAWAARRNQAVPLTAEAKEELKREANEPVADWLRQLP